MPGCRVATIKATIPVYAGKIAGWGPPARAKLDSKPLAGGTVDEVVSFKSFKVAEAESIRG